MKYKLIPAFCRESGYTIDAVNSKIDKGIWLEGVHWLYAPDGHRVIIIEGFYSWLENTKASGKRPKRVLKSISTTTGNAAKNGSSLSPPPLVK